MFDVGLRGSHLVPSSWSWERDAVGFYKTHHNVFLILAIAYYQTRGLARRAGSPR